MVEALKLYKKEAPTIFNKEMAIGFFAASVPGAIIGGIIGKNRMKREQSDGKLVGEPSTRNKSSLLGGLIGINVGAAVGALAATIISASGIGALILIGSAIAGGITGAKVGGNKGKEEQEKEYAEALQQQSTQKTKSTSIGVALAQDQEKNHAAEILRERASAQAFQRQ